MKEKTTRTIAKWLCAFIFVLGIAEMYLSFSLNRQLREMTYEYKMEARARKLAEAKSKVQTETNRRLIKAIYNNGKGLDFSKCYVTMIWDDQLGFVSLTEKQAYDKWIEWMGEDFVPKTPEPPITECVADTLDCR